MTYAAPASNRKWAWAAVCCLLLSACAEDGSDGADGAPGTPGPPGVGVTAEAESLTFAVDGITIASPPVVDFTLTNERGVRFIGLAQGQPRFTLAKLVPAAGGNPAYWQSYINRTETKGAGAWGAGGTAIQATSESNGTLENHGDGTYTYTFATNVTAVTSPLAVTWQPALTHRLGVQISGGANPVPVTNFTYDFRPSDGATTGIDRLDIVQTASCNECHAKLAEHGGSRIETKYCVTCHNPGSKDANSGNTVDFKVMIHKIHRGEFLPSVEAGGSYKIWGNSDAEHDYSEVALPQDIRNCTKCHDGADAATPQGGAWDTEYSVEACGSCHDDVNFATGEGHTSGEIVAQNGECTICHGAGFAPTPAEAHVIDEKVEAAKYAFNIISVTNTAPGQAPSVTYEVTDPTNGDAAWDVDTDPRFTSSTAQINLLFGWGDSRDYHNVGNGSATTPASGLALNGRVSGSNNTAPVDNGDGTFTVTSTKLIPASGVSGSGTLAMYGRAAVDLDGDTVRDEVPIKAAVKAFAITDAVAVARRTVVDGDKCDACHDRLILHGSRHGEPQMCAICHNPDNSDVSRRGGVAGVDGLFERTIDFKVMVHAIHGAAKRENPYVVYGFGSSINDFSHVGYPGILNNCLACHAEPPDNDDPPTFGVPLMAAVNATTLDSNVVNDVGHADDINVTPAAAVCSSCHDSSLAQTHMEQNGATFVMVGDPGSYNETCAVCHGPGRTADVSEVHAFTP